jgi:hypothetical protein
LSVAARYVFHVLLKFLFKARPSGTWIDMKRALIFALSALTTASFAGTTYSVTPLGSLPNTDVLSVGSLNDSGVVAGYGYSISTSVDPTSPSGGRLPEDLRPSAV